MLNTNLKALRRAKGLSQEELADQLHIVRQTVSKWEKGWSVPDAAMLIALAEALDTTFSDLLGDDVPTEEERITLREVADSLAALNARLAEQQEKRRKRWRGVSLAAGGAAVLLLVKEGLDLLEAFRFQRTLDADEAIIGGADSATHLFVSSISPETGRWLLILLLGAAAVYGLLRTRRR